MEIPVFSGKKSKVVIRDILGYNVYYIYKPSPGINCGIAIYNGSEPISIITLYANGKITCGGTLYIDSTLTTEAIMQSFINTCIYVEKWDNRYGSDIRRCYAECYENYDIKCYYVNLFLSCHMMEKSTYRVLTIDEEGYGVDGVLILHFDDLEKFTQEGIDLLNTHSESLLRILCSCWYIHIPGVNRLIRDYIIFDTR